MKEEFLIESLDNSKLIENNSYQKYKNFENQNYLKNSKLSKFIIMFNSNHFLFYLINIFILSLFIYIFKKFEFLFSFNLLYTGLLFIFCYNFVISLKQEIDLNYFFDNLKIKYIFIFFIPIMIFLFFGILNDLNYILLGFLFNGFFIFCLKKNTIMSIINFLNLVYLLIFKIELNYFKLIICLLLGLFQFYYIYYYKKNKYNFYLINHYEGLFMMILLPLFFNVKYNTENKIYHLQGFLFFLFLILFSIYSIVLLKLILINLNKVNISIFIIAPLLLISIICNNYLNIIFLIFYLLEFKKLYKNKENNIKRDLTYNN